MRIFLIQLRLEWRLDKISQCWLFGLKWHFSEQKCDETYGLKIIVVMREIIGLHIPFAVPNAHKYDSHAV